MPLLGRQFDFELDGKGYVLTRQKGARSWHRTGVPDSPERRAPNEARYGELPGELDFVTVWDDWSGGFGNAYRRPEEPHVIHWSENADTRFPKQLVHCQAPVSMIASGNAPTWNTNVDDFSILPDQASPPRTPARFVLACGKGYTVTWQPNGLSGPTPANNRIADHSSIFLSGSPNNVFAQPALFASFVYIGHFNTAGSPPGTFERGTISGGAAGTYSTIPGRAFVVAGNRLWRAHGPGYTSPYLQSVAEGADPLITANYSATLTIGFGNANIKRLVALNDQVFAATDDGLYAGDHSGTFYNILAAANVRPHDDNGRDLTIHDGGVVIPTVSGVYRYVPSPYNTLRTADIQEIGPQSIRSNRSPISGHIRVVHAYGPWLYAGLYTGSQSHILAAREDQGAYRWHSLQRLPHTTKIARLLFDGITKDVVNGINAGRSIPERLWIATDASLDTGGTAPLYAMHVPPLNGNPLLSDAEFTANYTGSFRIDLGRDDRGAPGTFKAWRAFEVWTEASSLTGTANGQWAEVYYSVDGKGFVYLDTAATSPKSVLYLPSTAGSFVSGQDIEYSVRSFTASLNKTPVYRAFLSRGALMPDSIDTIDAQVHVADGLRDRYGQELRDAAAMIGELRALARSRVPVVLIDPSGAQSIVKVMPPVGETEWYQEGEDWPHISAQVRMAVMTFTSG